MIEPYVTEKQCKTCRECKPITEFFGQAAAADGHQNVCKACKRAGDRGSYARRLARGQKRNRNATRRVEPLWPLPTYTLTDSLDCIQLRKWRGPVSREPLRLSL